MVKTGDNPPGGVPVTTGTGGGQATITPVVVVPPPPPVPTTVPVVGPPSNVVTLPAGSIIVTQAEMDALQARLAAVEATDASLASNTKAVSDAIGALQSRVAKAEAAILANAASGSKSGKAVAPDPGKRQPNSHFSYTWTSSTYTRKMRDGSTMAYNVVCFTSASIWATKSETSLLVKCQTFGWADSGLSLLPRWAKKFTSKRELKAYNFKETITGASYVTWKNEYSSSSIANAAVDAMTSGAGKIVDYSERGYYDRLGWA